jgi:hypothetical protein
MPDAGEQRRGQELGLSGLVSRCKAKKAHRESFRPQFEISSALIFTAPAGTAFGTGSLRGSPGSL